MKWGLAGVAAAFLGAPLPAQTMAEAGGLVIADGAARSAGPAARAGAGYFSVTNTGAEADRLLAAESEAGQRVDLHTTALEDGIARMMPLEGGIPIPAGETVVLEQGGDHVMFMGLTEAWDAEAGVPVTLVFELAGEVDVRLPVAEAPAGMRHEGHGG